jgi:hypothetical protein
VAKTGHPSELPSAELGGIPGGTLRHTLQMRGEELPLGLRLLGMGVGVERIQHARSSS